MPQKPVVVVIEDHTELRHVLRDVLGDEGYEVLPVRDSAEAIEVLRGRSVDLLVSDLPEHDGGGEDPLADIARDFPELGVIILSEDSTDAGPFFGPWRVSGSRITLRKPFRLDDLIAAAKEVIG
jgi:CheY-like chemotaxis protein